MSKYVLNARTIPLVKRDAFTLVELLMAIVILTVGVFGVLSFVINTSYSIQLARDLTVATTHANYILEEMKASDTLAEITSTTWDVNSLDAQADVLSNEVITVTYDDAAADPLHITINVAWSNSRGSYATNFITEMTK